ncbi:MAG: aldo/keto reductase [Actinomycetota bacterium]|nr:aldo/keto reductase [Actinomycetota bacterium]
MSPAVPVVRLNNGVDIPQLGFGVWQVPDDEVGEAIAVALEAGYRSIDTAAIYGNEAGVGRAIAAAAVPRDELFVTTKVWNSDQGYESTLRAFDESLGRLGLDYVDLYLIHWPVPSRDAYVDTWRALEKIAADGRSRAIGVSNFQAPHLERLISECSVVPAINQIELHPRFPQQQMREFHARHGIATEAWSPLAQGGLLNDPVVAAMADRMGKTSAQVILRWHIQLGNVVIPKSVTPDRIRQNLDVFDFELSSDDLEQLARLETGVKVGPDPDTFSG